MIHKDINTLLNNFHTIPNTHTHNDTNKYLKIQTNIDTDIDFTEITEGTII